jgi:hypothetical protein
MPSDQQVHPRLILRALGRLQRQGRRVMLEELEQAEPELASYLMENLSLIHRRLSSQIASEAKLRGIHRRIEELCLVCLEALRQGHRELWQQSISGTPLAELEQGENEKPDPPGEPTAE